MAGPGFFFAIEKRSHLVPSRSNWVESHTDLRHHPKLQPTASALGISIAQLCGHLHFLWHWCLDYQDDGDVTRYTEETIAKAAGFDGDCNAFVSALRNGGWLDSGARTTVHNWPEYAGKLLRRRAATSSRVAIYRERKKRNALRNAPVTPLTVPNRTVPVLKNIRAGRPEDFDEVVGYWAEASLEGDPRAFYDHFEARGWRTREGALKDWRAAARNWSRGTKRFEEAGRVKAPAGKYEGISTEVKA